MTNANQIFDSLLTDTSAYINASVDEETPRKDSVLKYDFDPLSLVLGLLDQGSHYTDIHNMLTCSSEVIVVYKPAKYNDIFTLINDFQSKSETIRRYFKHRLFLRRLNNQYISKYMEDLDDVLADPFCLKLSNIKILLKLPDFYREGIETDNLFKNYQSVKPPVREDLVSDYFQFVKKISRHSKKENKSRYYFTNSNKNLLLIESVTGSNERHLLDYISKLDKPIFIEGYCNIKHQPGYEEFLIYQNGNFQYFIEKEGK
jgi:hypothetical protein